MSTKVCSTCKNVLPISDFWADKKVPSGCYYECKGCARSRLRNWQSKNRALRSEYERGRSQSHRRKDPAYRIWKGAKDRAALHGIPFSISRYDVSIPSVCPVTGIPLVLTHRRAQGDSPSLDRIDPLRGYVPGNVIVVCWRVNRIKSDASLDELRSILSFYEALR